MSTELSIGREQAERIVLDRLNREPDNEDRFVIINSELAPRGDCWIIRANSAAYVESGDFSRMFVGVNAYLVDTANGTIEIVGSGETIEDYLQERYDERDAGGRHYVLACAIDRNDKPGLLCLHRALNCSLAVARQLIDEPHRLWLHGRKQVLMQAADLLRRRGVAVSIVLTDAVDDLPHVPDWPIDIDDLREPICRPVVQSPNGEE